MALLHLAAQAGVAAAVASVDHCLRPGSAAEAAGVARACAALGLPHDTLVWDWDGRGNLQAAARAARRRLLADWARARGLTHVALGHTADDQAETVLMEISRAAGPQGQSGMAARSLHDGIVWLRPLLGETRAGLRDWLEGQGIGWVDDPSNDNPRFARVRARRALAGQPAATPALIALAATRRAEAEAITAAAREAARDVTLDRGEMRLPLATLTDLPPAVRRRLIGAALVWLAPPGPAPRGRALTQFLDRIATGEGGPLHGCRARIRRGTLILSREPAAPRASDAAAGPVIWDRHWRLTLSAPARLAPLGLAGVAALSDWRATGLGRDALAASPAIFDGPRPIAATHPLHGATTAILPATWPAAPDDFTTSGFLH